MSADTKVAGRDKLAKLDPKIGYPDRWEYYDKLTIEAVDLMSNSIRANELCHDKELESLLALSMWWTMAE